MSVINLRAYIKSFTKMISRLGFTVKSVKHETKSNNVYVNIQSICMGVYFEKTNLDLTIWTGYWEKHGYCISFFSKSTHVDVILKKYFLDFSSDYISFDEGYWYTINLQLFFDNAKKISQQLKEQNGDIDMANFGDNSGFEREFVSIFSMLLNL